MEKRAFTRRPMRLEGTCSAPGKGSRNVEIRDFCPGGMLLAFDSLTTKAASVFSPLHGDVIDITCVVPLEKGETRLVFRGRVVRIDGEGVGLAFIDPDLTALHVLHGFGKKRAAAVAAHASSPEAKTGKIPLEAGVSNSLLRTCQKKALTHLDALTNSFLVRVAERLFTGSGAVLSVPEKNAYLEAINTFNRQGESFKRQFLTRLGTQLKQVNPQGLQPQANDLNASEKTLSLVEEDVFAEWLAVSDLARRAEAEFLASLTDLGFRMSALYGVPVNKSNNPFGPNAIAKSFQEELAGLGLHLIALSTIYAAFRDVLLEELGELYDDLNRYLIDNAILPDLKLKYKVKSAKMGGDQIRRLGSQPQTLSAQRDSLYERVVSTPGQSPRTSSSTSDWYRLVQDLTNLQQQTARQAAFESETEEEKVVGSASPTAKPAEYYTPQELLFALSQVKFSGEQDSVPHKAQRDVKSQLISILSDSTDDNQPKELPQKEEKILDVAQTLFGSVLNDKLISSNVLPWLEQLSVPMFKVAIRDDSVFSDKNHLVRELINNIAQLEFYGESAGDAAQNGVTKRVNDLVAKITSAMDISPELLTRITTELSLFIRLQNKAYQENMQEVVAEEEAGNKSDEASNGVISQMTTSGLTRPGSRGLLMEALGEWKKRVLRMEVGTALMLNVNSNPRRVKLAWVAKNFERYVFVNVKGLKEIVLTPDEIAHQLYRGTAKVLDDDAEPLLDRAQYSMLQKMHHELLHETTHDRLTGLINRREFEQRLTSALASARKDGLRHSVCYLDLDQFSIVNNTFGYDGGDRLLVEVAKLLEENIGSNGVLARIGGDEFGMLFENCPKEKAATLMSQQKTVIEGYRFNSDKKSLSVSFSAGLVEIDEDSNSVITLLQAAESSCRLARGRGINYLHLFNPQDSELMHQTQIVKWVSRIDEALDQNTLTLRYQLIAGLSDDLFTPHHAEILLSVQDEQGSAISPAEFVLAAEHFRRMAAVDRWVIERVFQWMVANNDKVAEVGGFAINLSGSSLNEADFAEFILEMAEKTQVPMHQVCFEITETAGIANLSNASDFILRVKKTGCMFSLDDFGSGLSSYAYLKNLPVDFLKIDGAFVKNMDENPYDYAVVKSITEIGHFMGKKIIAEYIEKETVLTMLREIGVDFGQGYVIAKPKALWEVPLRPPG